MYKSSVKVLQDDLLAFVPERSGMDAILLCLISEMLRGESVSSVKYLHMALMAM